jgi:hypothetical protein
LFGASFVTCAGCVFGTGWVSCIVWAVAGGAPTSTQLESCSCKVGLASSQTKDINVVSTILRMLIQIDAVRPKTPNP